MEQVIAKIGDIKMSNRPEEILGTLFLGSCLGVAIYDPVVKVGAIIHMLLPKNGNSGNRHTSFFYVDTGIDLLFKVAEVAGGRTDRMRVYAAGGASFKDDKRDLFAVGKRNIETFNEALARLGIRAAGLDLGGSVARSLFLDIGTGRAWIATREGTREL